MGEYLILIEFAGSSYAEANLLAAELEEVINREMAAVRVPARPKSAEQSQKRRTSERPLP